MEKVSKITRMDIIELIKNKFENSFTDNYYGRIWETDFLARVFDLRKIEIHDTRFNKIEDEIWQHTINNYDWPNGWVFDDNRFGLLDGDDEIFLNFLCEMFHPEVRKESNDWRNFLKSINDCLNYDNIEIYEQKYISGRAVYSWKNKKLSLEIKRRGNSQIISKSFLAEGSYANIFVFKDEFMDEKFAIKSLKNGYSEEDKKRFQREFEFLKKWNNLFLLKVYSMVDETSYIMELMDQTLFNYIKLNNNSLTLKERKLLGNKIINGFEFIHSQKTLHRDISPHNILIKKYNDQIIPKISDFGLAKLDEIQSLTREGTKMKGKSYNDPKLAQLGWDKYNYHHEIYALTYTLLYVITGITNLDKLKYKKYYFNVSEFMEKGMDYPEYKRFKSINELKLAFNRIDLKANTNK
ncbi:protein kinase domain-containing protein [Spiroplasma alleghenense]|uniref:Protein kinase domain-containing protein n=1 Tax=Spiroplasma alleghenense TaxID=216931 RepID=A0A345Z4V7_9MOLU|nr:protein kinase [Spiroplasma alleghenense]AXK51636.1 hypothetical protein SALLE_v1c09660 [Spiroplasma alleghenense]